MLRFLLIVALGAAGGGLLGSTRSCTDGGCPLTATPLRGSIYGACLAALFGLTVLQSAGCKQAVPETPPSAHLLLIESTEQFEREVLAAKSDAIVDFYADWCGPCRQLAPVMNELAEELAGEVKVVKVNVDKNQELAQKYGVRSIPDVRLFLTGQEVAQLVGVQAKEVYVEQLNQARDKNAER